MEISEYHKKYAALSDAEIDQRAAIKKEELSVLVDQVKLETQGDSCKIAIIGCGDPRLIKRHQVIFSEFCGRPVDIITLDIVISHLEGEENIFQHDCTEPLPGGPYDVTYGHVMLRFVHPDHQWDIIKNTYDALKPGGLAIQVLDFLDFTTESKRLPNGLYSVPLRQYQDRMDKEGMPFIEVMAKKGLVLVMQKPLN